MRGRRILNGTYTRVEAEEDATKRREGAHQVGLRGDWRFDPIEIGRRMESNGSSRHCRVWMFAGALSGWVVYNVERLSGGVRRRLRLIADRD